jgi:release factor glutamine methyltransferase
VTDGLVRALRAAGCVFAEEEAAILRETSTDPVRLQELVARRVRGEPLEQVVGWARFAGVRLVVHPGVFVPRVRTEALVRQALRVTPPDAVVLDLCCGSGAVGAAIAAHRPGVRLWASDIDPAAVANARENIAAFDGTALVGDLDDAIPVRLRDRVDVLVANVPYVPSSQLEYLPTEARDHERRIALDGGDDGLDLLRRLAPRVRMWLRTGGWFLTECASDQAEAAVALLHGAGLDSLAHNDNDRDVAVVSGQRRIDD